MTWTTNSCLVTLAVLLVWRAEEIAEACSCSPAHPQQAFCNSDVVIRAKLVGRQEVDAGNDVYGNTIKRIKYDIKQIKMFKGPSHDIDAIYTAPSSALCGVSMDTNGKKEYLITGKLETDGTMHVTLCDFIDEWEALTATQKKNLIQRYESSCDCKITHCTSIPCVLSSPTECLWTDWVIEKTVKGEQTKHYACIKRNDDSCAWYRGSTPPRKEFLDIEDP
ncbi:Metalloproteinase inhibitor 2 [Oryzias melastigma]|uniref:Metalloproteinase inhibitor 2 n=1 Tax=Oryzias melastigma TaxID=30732 RepID=A0A3B3BQX5_ORYME|nr:metalloproteinase inhibitor 2b [Oryzias melastigma]KAF6732519.1 Metalloproteinase inhibitor 2 [Oryzias melastigma]